MKVFYLCNTKIKNRIEQLNLTTEELHFGFFSENTNFIQSYFRAGGRQFVAVGGDGTVFDLMNGLYQMAKKENISFSDFQIGAIAAGSSNDFHKFEAKIPQFGLRRDDFSRLQKSDLMLFQFNDKTYVSTLNASLGLTAEANAFFNSNSKVLKFFKSLNMEAAIVYSALRTLFSFKSVPLLLNEKKMNIANLGIAKSRFFAGSFHYPDILQADSGKFGVFIIPSCSKLKMINALLRLERNQFHRIPQASANLETNLSIRSEQNFLIEINGEVFETNNCEVQILAGAANLCTPS